MCLPEILANDLTENGQEHVVKYWKSLNGIEEKIFLNQLKQIKFKTVNQLFNKAQESLNQNVQKLDELMEPVPSEQFSSESRSTDEELNEYRKLGLENISEGKVAVLLMAGGQGTRLGVGYPKGMYSVGLPSGKTLFQIQAERIIKLENLAEEETGKRGCIRWYIMTSVGTNDSTKKYLKENKFFGLKEENVILFKQGFLPCFDFNGKILLEDKNVIAVAPDGNGGIYRALDDEGILENMTALGVKYVHVHSVDNILVKVADPVFVGYCITKQADCGAKVVSKNAPNEAVGVVCKVNGKFQVVEYSEITDKTANLRNKDGNLVFSAGNICNHFFTTEFLLKVAKKYETQMKLHVAKKKIPYLNDDGVKIRPTSPNGIKIEKFVFDVFQFADNFVTWEVPRISEFSALKNDDSVQKDCPATARRDLLRLHKKYIENAGGSIRECVDVEISPLLSYAGENLESKVKGKIFNETTVLLSKNEEDNQGLDYLANRDLNVKK